VLQTHVFINEELIKNGYAKWIDEAEYYRPEDYMPELSEAFDAVALGNDEAYDASASSEETDVSSARSDDTHKLDIDISSLNATRNVSDINSQVLTP